MSPHRARPKLCTDAVTRPVPLPSWASPSDRPAGRTVCTPPQFSPDDSIPIPINKLVPPWACSEQESAKEEPQRKVACLTSSLVEAAAKAATATSEVVVAIPRTASRSAKRSQGVVGKDRRPATDRPSQDQDRKAALTLLHPRTSAQEGSRNLHAGHAATLADVRIALAASETAATQAKTKLATADLEAAKKVAVLVFGAPVKPPPAGEVVPCINSSEIRHIVKAAEIKKAANERLKEALDAQLARKLCRQRCEKEEDRCWHNRVLADEAQFVNQQAEAASVARSVRMALQKEVLMQRKELEHRRAAERVKAGQPEAGLKLGSNHFMTFRATQHSRAQVAELRAADLKVHQRQKEE
ncbi:unnamed protein product, partial [Polarella glacialis]